MSARVLSGKLLSDGMQSSCSSVPGAKPPSADPVSIDSGLKISSALSASHGSHGGHGMHRAPFARDRSHGDDAYNKAASDDLDKLLNTQIKSICRGC